MPGTLQPLDSKFAIVDRNGNPTEYFTRWAQQKQIDIGDSITLTDLQAYLTAHKLIPGTGIQLTPDGDINDGVTIHADVQAILDEVTATRGAVLYRGLLGWAALAPGTAGNFLQTAGAGADPLWAAGGGGSSTPWYWSPPATSAFPLVTSSATNVPTIATDSDVGLVVTGGPVAGDNNIRAWYASIPNRSTAWQATAHINHSCAPVNFSFTGMFALDTTNSKALAFGRWNNLGVAITHHTFAVNQGTDFSSTSIGGVTDSLWQRIVFDGTNYKFLISGDGKNWVQIFQETAATWLSAFANGFGFGVVQQTTLTGTPLGLSVDNFSKTY